MAHVLVIDDSPNERESLQSILEGADHEMSVVADTAGGLAFLESRLPDALLVDVSTPGFDGAEFVDRVREKSARLPILLMSSRGQENAVIQALQKGASSYVPRDLLSQELPATLSDVLSYSKKEDCQFRLMSQMTELRCRFELENDRSLIPPLVSYLQGHIGRMGICDESDLVRVGIALDEALVNALQHGNLELDSELREQGDVYHELANQRINESPYAERVLHVSVHLTRDAAEIVIQDEGPGFDVASLPDPRDPANVERMSGRGILLMRTFMDEVVFNETGNEVTLRKVRGTESV